MRLSRCIITLGAGMGLALMLTLGSARNVKADCGDGVTTVGEACDNGTAICQAPAKNAGSECTKSSDCQGTSTAPGTDSSGDLCRCGLNGGTNRNHCNRDDVPSACRGTCMFPMCGDGISDSGEQCDNGAKNGPNDACLGNAPNSVCACNPSGGGACAPGTFFTSDFVANNPLFLPQQTTVPCTTDADCGVTQAAIATASSGLVNVPLRCTGNPQCHRNVCGDKQVCSNADCPAVAIDAVTALATHGATLKLIGEQCDDGNTTDSDSCHSATFSASVGTLSFPDACAPNLCGDGSTQVGVEECDAGVGICVTGPKAPIGTSVTTCTTDKDCTAGGLTGLCSGGGGATNIPGAGFDNRDDIQNCALASTTVGPNTPGAGGNITCRSNCKVPSCGDGVSDSLGGDCVSGTNTLTGKNDDEQCDNGTSTNGPGNYCNHVKKCMGGENPGSLCTSNADCIKGMCGNLQCLQNACGDGVLGGNEQCDDGNTNPADDTAFPTDHCGLSGARTDGTASLCGRVTAILVSTTGCDPTLPQNTSLNGHQACPECGCILPFCGDGITNAGEMCDGGRSQCVAPAINAGAPCAKASDCKNPSGVATDLCLRNSPTDGHALNRDDVPNACRSNCMPASCGDGVTDAGEACEPPASGTFCVKNPAGQCVLATCGDGDVCNKTANSACVAIVTAGSTCPVGTSVGTIRPTASTVCCTGPIQCTTGPQVDPNGVIVAATGGNEQCDDANTITPSATNTDSCFPNGSALPAGSCAKAACGDGVTEAGEQCDSNSMGCSNMQEDLSLRLGDPELAPTCCIDGNVVDTGKDTAPGLINVETAFRGLLDCRLPNLISAASCNASLEKLYVRIRNKALAAQVRFENNDVAGARRMLTQAFRQLDRMSRRIAQATKPGKSCAGKSAGITNQTANASDLTIGIVSHLTENNPGFGS